MKSQKIYWTLSYVFVSLTLGMIIVHWNDLPDQVAMHFNAKGEPDRFGSKSELFIVPLIGAGLAFMMQWMNKKFIRINPSKLGAKTSEQLALTKN